MEYQIRGNPDQANLTLALNAGDSVFVESGSMSFMSSHLQVQPRLVGRVAAGGGPQVSRRRIAVS